MPTHKIQIEETFDCGNLRTESSTNRYHTIQNLSTV